MADTITATEQRIREIEEKIRQKQHPYTLPSNLWVGGIQPNPWDMPQPQSPNPWDMPQPQSPNPWGMPQPQSPTPVVAPEIRHETIKRYAEAGVPFPLDKDEAFAKLASFVGEIKAYLELEGRTEDATIHVTEQTFRLFQLSMPYYEPTRERKDGCVGYLAGTPMLVVDDESQQGVFAPLEPFYRFAFV